MIALILAHFLAAGVAPALVRILDRRAFWILALVPGTSFLWLLPRVVDATRGEPTRTHLEWIASIGVDIDLVITPLTGIVSLLVTGIGALVLLYSSWYFKPDDSELWRFTAVFTSFAGAMLGLVLSDNVYLLYVFWELTTVLSFLLVGHNPERKANRRAAMNALLVTTFGGLAMLVGLVILHVETGTSRFSTILADPPSGTLTEIAVALLLIGAISKSALVPFHFWLPGAMAAPTPVSAYLHAAAMVKAGVFLVALMAPAFADIAWWRPTLITLGIATMMLGGLRALRQYDIKLLLAYGTVSQLGLLTLLAGLGTRSAAFAGLALLCAHALFKATLFLIVGIVDRQAGTRDLRDLSGLHRSMPVALAATVLAAASMAGLPPLFGFTAKESALAALVDLGHDTGADLWGAIALVGVVAGSVLTVGYTARFVWGAFGRKRDVVDCGIVHRSPAFGIAPVVLATLCLAGGLAGPLLTPAFAAHAESLPEGSHEAVLTLWHGWTLPLLLSAVTFAGGLALFLGRRPVARSQQKLAEHMTLPDAELVYHAVVRGLDRLSVEVTGRTQRGSLPFYLGVILFVLLVVPGAALLMVLTGDDKPTAVRIADAPIQVVVCGLICLAAVLGVRSRRRLRAVLLVGVTGYGTALLFVAHGAPDLALTQILVETFLLVTFVLVMRRLPPFFSSRPFTVGRWVRVAFGVLTGIAVAGFALVTTSAREARPVGQDFAEPAVSYGGGDNIVNVTLVDIRAWDTLGELSVLVVAATGVASLIYLITDRSGRVARELNDGTRRSWLGRSQPVPAERRSIVFEVVTRLLFHAIIVYSVYLMLVGHNAPGGGFAGGLVAGLALMVRYLAGGRAELDAAAPVDAGAVLGIGLSTAALAGLLPTLLGGGVLQSAIVDIPFGPLGELHLVTSVFFDIGVYLVVIGLALDVLRSLGGGIDAHQKTEESEGVAR